MKNPFKRKPVNLQKDICNLVWVSAKKLKVGDKARVKDGASEDWRGKLVVVKSVIDRGYYEVITEDGTMTGNGKVNVFEVQIEKGVQYILGVE